MIFNIIAIFTGIWLIRRSVNHSRTEYLETQLSGLRRDYIELQQKMRVAAALHPVTAEYRQLDRLILENAMRRESAAKSALEQVMKAGGCSEDQIGRVMAEIDREA